jgi:RNA polymerase sigma-70 factor (ECF subfamily)
MGKGEPASDGLEGEIAAFHPRLVRFAYSLTHNQEEAADLAQDAIVRALAAGSSFTPGTNLRAWLFRILQNLHLNRLRASAHRPRSVSIDDGLDLPARGRLSAVEEEALDRATLEEVLHEFRRLPPRYSIPIYLCSVEELSYSEIATRLGIPIGTVMSRIYRGRRLLLARLAQR